MLAQVKGGPKFRDLGEREKLNHSLVNKHVVWIDQWRQTVQPITDEAKNGNLEGLCLPFR